MRSLCLCCATLSLIGCIAWLYGLRVNVTPSVPRGLYRIVPTAPERGNLVAFCLDGPMATLASKRGYVGAGSCPSGLRPLLKYLAGLPGDLLSVAPEQFVLHEQDGTAHHWSVRPLPHDAHGRALDPQVLCGVIPPGQALVLTAHPGSFDSRYFGLVPLADLNLVEPFLTF